MEDLAYFGMDFRKDYSKPGEAPYQPSVANYTDNYILFISSSKVFSYAGERIGMMVISDNLYTSRYEDLKEFYPRDEFGYAMIFGTLYPLSSGTSHSAQYGLLGVLKATNSGEFNFVDYVKDYGVKAHEMKEIFLKHGFESISAISLLITGSERTEGIRACTSLVSHSQMPDLDARLKQFHQDYPIN